MSDLFLGQTCTARIDFISAGTAHTFTWPWNADKAVFYNITQWAGVAANLPVSVWWKDTNAAAEAFQQQVIDSAAGSSFNFIDTAAAGFTVANTAGGVTAYRSLISAVTAADPCVITTTAVHGLQTNQLIRITDLGSGMPTARGMDELNNKRFRVVVINTTSFSLKDPVSDEPVDSTNFVTWVAGGRIDLETRVLQLNNPQVDPYSNTNPYNPTPFSYNPIEYKLTADTAVMGSDGDVFVIELYKFGTVINLGDLLT
ncbi:MAG TPA: hypothetical protein VMX17_05115 [Candidatus Glassbacteria bacterium]|nr:hypothetical protein [Candidatus Glassbacteria bacterium]